MNKQAVDKLHQIFDAHDVYGHIQPFPIVREQLPSFSIDFAFTDVFLDSTETENVLAFYKDGVNDFEYPGFFQGKEYTPDENWFTHEHVAIALNDIKFVEYIPEDAYECRNVRIHLEDGRQFCVYITCRIGV